MALRLEELQERGADLGGFHRGDSVGLRRFGQRRRFWQAVPARRPRRGYSVVRGRSSLAASATPPSATFAMPEAALRRRASGQSDGAAQQRLGLVAVLRVLADAERDGDRRVGAADRGTARAALRQLRADPLARRPPRAASRAGPRRSRRRSPRRRRWRAPRRAAAPRSCGAAHRRPARRAATRVVARPSMRSTSTAIGDRLALAQREQLAHVLDSCWRCGRPVAEVGRIGAPRRAAEALALDRRAHPAASRARRGRAGPSTSWAPRCSQPIVCSAPWSALTISTADSGESPVDHRRCVREALGMQQHRVEIRRGRRSTRPVPRRPR